MFSSGLLRIVVGVDLWELFLGIFDSFCSASVAVHQQDWEKLVLLTKLGLEGLVFSNTLPVEHPITRWLLGRISFPAEFLRELFCDCCKDAPTGKSALDRYKKCVVRLFTCFPYRIQ